jgi:predicted NUDIX family phosphoesterase
MIASMIESLESEADVVLLDRGVFDAIVWLEAQRREHQVTEQECGTFRDFVLLDRWRKLTDLTFVLRVAPGTAVERENQDLLIRRTGTIMDAGRLERYNQVLADVQATVRSDFSFVDIDTIEHGSPQAATHAIATALVEHMSRWADPKIAAIPRQVAEQVFRDGGIRALPDGLQEVERALEFHQRSTLERSSDFVQIVGATVLRHADKLLLLRRSEEQDEKRRTFGRDVLWKGCHLPRTDSPSALVEMASTAVKSRIKEDFHLAQLDSEPTPRFLVWNRNDDIEARHLVLLFDLEIPAPEVARSLAEKVFKRERDRTKLCGSQFVAPGELLARVENDDDIELESWSREVLRHMMAARS